MAGRPSAAPASEPIKRGEPSLESCGAAGAVSGGGSELLALRDRNAAIDARIDEVLERVDSDQYSKLLKELETTWEQVERVPEFRNHIWDSYLLYHLGASTFDQPGVWLALEDIRDLVEERRHLVEVEQKQRAELQKAVAVGDLLALMALLVDAARAAVTDDRTVESVAARPRGTGSR